MLNKLTRKQATHERIVAVAARAIRRAGINGVGVADMMKEAGLTHGGFYAHFESRDALVVEAIRRAWVDSSTALKEAMASRVACGESDFAALVYSYLHENHLEQIECGCVVAALASEMPRMVDAVRDEARRNVNALIALVRSTLPAGVDPACAEGAAARMVGALQLARVLGGKAGRDLLVQTSRQLITEFEPISHH
ncbi:TetR/AcrR family transcriptional regulator [Dickeya lacustris]|uniref:TetR/AcrR family transcriptional regulator n=1 Tax=Dickeya lacustris TaxID=2259638 RepID=A0ABY8G6Y3_9GAMM|nr:TetR/AcrR family transcriptional regulator [Dickeya lacustris]WFN55716.1 TetR/AcrR family transcriptional regulator [Dickeya lacustris]